MATLSVAATPGGWPRRLRYVLLVVWWRCVSVFPLWQTTARFHLGNACYAYGRRSAALQAWEAAADAKQGHLKALHNLANGWLEAQRWPEAAAAYRRLGDARGDASYAYLAGKCHFALNERQAAREDFERCIEIDPQHVGALEHLGRLALVRRDGAAAHALLLRALPHANNPQALHFLLGAASELNRDPAAALAHYREVQHEPLRAQAAARLARIAAMAAASANDLSPRSDHGH